MAGQGSGEALQETKFGFWYPRGYVLVAFQRRDDADQVRHLLLAGGYGEADIEVADAGRIEALASRHLSAGSTVTKILGTEHESEARYLSGPGGQGRQGDQPEAGHRHRPLGSPEEGRQGPAPEARLALSRRDAAPHVHSLPRPLRRAEGAGAVPEYRQLPPGAAVP